MRKPDWWVNQYSEGLGGAWVSKEKALKTGKSLGTSLSPYIGIWRVYLKETYRA